MLESDDQLTSGDDVVAVFWTGGWDSTMRVLDLVVHYGCRVQPIYIVDRTRRSWSIELERMDLIREKLQSDYPDRASGLLPMNRIELSDLDTSKLENHPYFDFAERFNTSPQYAFLSLVSEAAGYPKIEVAMHAEDNASDFEILRENVREVHLGCGATTLEMSEITDPQTPTERAMKVFDTYRLPYLFTHPNELAEMAKSHGLNSMLGLTFTCRIPFRGEPCGVCETCRYAISAGKTEHFSKSALLRYRFAPILNPVWIMIVNPKGGLKAIAKRLRLTQS